MSFLAPSSREAFDAITLVDRPWFPYLCTEVQHWQWETQGEPHFNFWVALAGNGYLSCDGQTYPIKPGSFFIFSPRQTISAAHYFGQRITRFSAHFHPIRQGQRLTSVEGLPSLGRIAESLDTVHRQIDRIMRIALRREDDALLCQALCQLLQASLDQHSGALPVAASLDERVAGAIRRLRDNPASINSMDQLAHSLGLSRSHFDRKFTEQIGQAPNHFLINCKMIHARRLIKNTQLRVGEVAQSLGYKDIFFFSRQFKAYYGVAPKHYRQNAQLGAID